VNSIPLFCLDTHAVYWHRLASSKLSAAASQVFEDGIQGRALLIVSYVVVAELYYLLHKYGQADLSAPLLRDFQTFPYFFPLIRVIRGHSLPDHG
jgi:PIN domain nuclease of toxin-antitoxin system